MDDDEVLARALEIVRERAAGTRPSLTVSQLYEPYARAKAKVKSWPVIAGKLRPVLEWFGDRQCMSIRIADTEEYREHRRTYEYPGGKGRTLSDLTINFELQWLKCMFTWGVRGGRLAHNPLQAMKDAKVKKVRKTSPTEEEIGLLLARCDTVMRAFVLLAADSGLRRDEARLARWDWFNESERLVTLPAASTKSQKERRAPVTARTFAAIKLLPRHLRSPFIFCSPDRKDERPRGAEWFNDKFRDIVSAAGVKAAPGDGSVRIHDLRHAAARRMARAGVRVEVISRILGHATLQQTMVYLQTGDDDVIDALETFEDALRKPAKRATGIEDVGAGRIATPEK
ncbi:MAG TPA: tyrosine-type recombinase/integrase [Gemmatimonadales bacterium]|nr:tyrosine-type recombinase/integrase [Gemmatimonadales bacterium]